ncbi:MAG: sigma-70 family RNA polymerase sigma factor [Planctomycetes bacterium]|nr:sigma-70 family RNA polymerase sigma factor [Planctomycetota bacterium]MCC7170975.1 sigma-70 family RNA polymerase sigma factor [Planctomycetota bacterium]
MNDDSDFELVRRCQSADPEVYEAAFRELYERYQERIFNTALRVVGNGTDAADVAQEVFLTVFRKIGEFQFNSRFFTWLYRITVNLSIDRKRRINAAPPVVGEHDGEGLTLATLPDREPNKSDAYAQNEFVERRVQASIGRLSPKLRAIVVLRYVEGLAYGDIAEILSCSIGTVKSRLNRAHRNLEQLLRPIVEELAGRGEA